MEFQRLAGLRHTAVVITAHDRSMCRASETPIERIHAALNDMPAWMATQPSRTMAEVVIEGLKIISRVEGFSSEATARVEKSGAYKAEGALGIIPWLKDKAKLSGADAVEHVQLARQMAHLPRTQEALFRGEIGYQHALTIARSAEHVGSALVRKAEATLLKSAETLDAGRFVGVVKDFEHRVDADAALSEANRAHQRRYLSISEPINGLAHIEGQLVAEAAATIRSAMEPFMKPSKGDDRSAGQRAHDALVEVCQRATGNRPEASTPKPQIIITTSVETLAGIAGAPAARVQGGGTLPAETVRRLACDSAITRITGLGELEQEITHASRVVPPATRRALVARDEHCVFPGCDRPAPWCDGHHLTFWADGGPTKLDNLGLVCGGHHRKVHEEGWRLERKDGQWIATPPVTEVTPRARSRPMAPGDRAR